MSEDLEKRIKQLEDAMLHTQNVIKQNTNSLWALRCFALSVIEQPSIDIHALQSAFDAAQLRFLEKVPPSAQHLLPFEELESAISDELLARSRDLPN